MISVCIASYNGGAFIRQQLLSVLCQIGKDDEVIVSDDGSTDNTVFAVKSLRDKRIKIIEGPGVGSPAVNFENALRAAKGDYIFLADQDDVWLAGKVVMCMEYLKQYSCVVSDAIVADGELKETSHSFFLLNKTKYGRWYNLFVKNGYLGCCMAFRREILEAALPFPKSTPMHDIWLGNVAAFKYNVKFIDKPLIYFRRHGHNNSTTARKSSYSLYDRLVFRLQICKGLMRLACKKKVR